MFSFKKSDSNYPIFQIVDKTEFKFKNYKPKIIYYTNKKDLIQEPIENDKIININHKKEELFILPHNLFKNIERRVYYVSGKSGSGKSYNISKTALFLLYYYKKYEKKNKKIIIFSVKPANTDPAYEKIKKYSVYIDLESLLNVDEYNILDLMKNNIVIFDDCDTINNKEILKNVEHIKNLLLEVGRSYNIDVFYVSHIVNNYRKSLTIWNEFNIKVIYPETLRSYHLNKILLKMGYSNKEQEEIKNKGIFNKSNYVKFIPSHNIIFNENKAIIYD
jgi:hypothetical protein